MDDVYSQFAEDLLKKDISVRRNVSGAELTTYRVGGDIAYLVTLANVEDVENLAALVKEKYQNILSENNVAVVGKGSNLIIDDDGFDGFIFVLNGMLSVFDDTQDSSNNELQTYGGTALPVLARQVCSLGLEGIEFYVGIPGSVGGAVAMNAGGHGKQTCDVLISTDVLNLSTGELKTYLQSECEFDYRKSRFQPIDMVVSAKYKISHAEPAELKAKLDQIVQWRRENQPGGRNVGSVFQNPSETSAGALIEKCGLKGYRHGSAYVSDKHANFIQADNEATAKDIRELIEHIRKTVYDQTGYELQTEVRYIGTKLEGSYE